MCIFFAIYKKYFNIIYQSVKWNIHQVVLQLAEATCITAFCCFAEARRRQKEANEYAALIAVSWNS
jgi:hypothetical protein